MEWRGDILVANEPGTYRHMLATELPRLRPGLRFLLTDPADLDAVVACTHPLLVICSRTTNAIQAHATAAIVLYPDGTDRAFVEVAGATRVLSRPRLADLLAMIDTIIALARQG